MTLEDLRIAVTVISFLVFLGLMGWAWSARNRTRFDEAAHLPFAHDGLEATEAHPTLRSERP
jgi:cytochrome c oxidase cbb3-type subunit 4